MYVLYFHSIYSTYCIVSTYMYLPTSALYKTRGLGRVFLAMAQFRLTLELGRKDGPAIFLLIRRGSAEARKRLEIRVTNTYVDVFRPGLLTQRRFISDWTTNYEVHPFWYGVHTSTEARRTGFMIRVRSTEYISHGNP